MESEKLKKLPVKKDIESKKVLKKLASEWTAILQKKPEFYHSFNCQLKTGVYNNRAQV